MPPKIKEDKTFGLKNKNKSTKVKKFVEQVQQQQQKKTQSEHKQQQAEKRKQQEQKEQELKMLFNTEIIQKVPFGVDPKTILCLNFKNKNCSKGAKCKFSHTLTTAQPEKKPITGTMEEWTQQQLQDAIDSKETENKNRNRKTDIICKYFLDAIESQKYGWFWTCPNGDTCIYRHMLPPGFVLKKKETLEEKREREEREKENQLTLEELIEQKVLLNNKRKELVNTTPVTEATFKEWKEQRILKQQQALEKEKLEKQEMLKKKNVKGLKITGRDLFEYNPEWEDEDGDVVEVTREEIVQSQDGLQEDGQDEGLEEQIEIITLDE